MPLLAAQRTVDTISAWSRLHAPLMLSAAALSLWLGAAWPAAVAGFASLSASVVQHRGRWTPSGALGTANFVTLLRLALILGLPLLPEPPGLPSALLVLAVFALDGLDGWLARRNAQASIWGAHLDMECDALLVLLCSLVLYQSGRLGAFILVPGLLRYVYSLFLLFVPFPTGEAPPSQFPRHAYSLMVTSLIASLWPVPRLHVPVALLATFAIVVSFARSVYYSLRRD